MPTPHPSEETREEYIKRCIPIVMNEGTTDDSSQAAAICHSLWDKATNKSERGTMKYKVRDFELDIKAIDEEGSFEGYASVYNVIDAYREVVVSGAFSKSLEKWKGKGRLPPVLWQHMSREPVGPFRKMVEDEKGLKVEGQLLVKDVQRAREARALVQAKAIGGLSIGFNTVIEEYNSTEKLISLKELDLWEVSLVTFPANEASQVEAVKSMLASGAMPSMREFEEILREVGFSRSHAKAIATHGLGRLLREAEGQDDAVDVADVKSVLDEVFKQPIITARELFP